MVIRTISYRLLFVIMFLLTGLSAFMQAKPDYSSLIKLKKGYQVYGFPNSFKQRISTFTIMDPGLTIIPLNGGLFVPGIKSWLAVPNKERPIVCSSFILGKKDTSFLLLTLDVKRDKMVLLRTKYLNNGDSAERLFSMPVSRYDVKVIGEKGFLLWGRIDNGSALWKSDFSDVASVFTSSSVIRDVDYVSENNYVLAMDSSIMAIGTKKAPEVLFKLDMLVESISIDKSNDGAVYASTPAGIVRFNSLDKDDVDVITKEIHGKIRVYQNRLYVLWTEKNQVVEILLK